MSDKLQIKKVNSKKPHKVYRADITQDSHITDLCRFLRRHTDKKLEIILGGKRVVFKSINERKKYAAGFERAFYVIEPYMEAFVKDLYDKINKLTNELGEARRETAQAKKQLSKEREEYRVKKEVIALRKAAYDDHLEEWKDNCLTLQRRVQELEAKHKKTRKPRQRKVRTPPGKTSIPVEEIKAAVKAVAAERKDS